MIMVIVTVIFISNFTRTYMYIRGESIYIYKGGGDDKEGRRSGEGGTRGVVEKETKITFSIVPPTSNRPLSLQWNNPYTPRTEPLCFRAAVKFIPAKPGTRLQS